MSGAVYALDAYDVLEKLGEGVFGEVFKCIHKETGDIVAVKHIKMSESAASTMLQEITALQAIESLDPDTNNLIRLNDWFESTDGYFMEFEMLDQSVYDLMTKRNSSFSLSEIRPMTKEILVALKGLREVGVIHTDLKPDNIMLVDHKNEPFKVKLIDFGVAILKDEAEIGEILQPAAYRSPEVTLGLPITEAIDMWSLGCCLLEWYLQIFPFNVENSYDSLRQITHLLGVPDGDLIMRAEEGTNFFVQGKHGQWRLKTLLEYRDQDGKIPKLEKNFLEAATGLDDAVLNSFEIQSGMEYEDRRAFLDLLKRMLEFDAKKRITPAEALKHPFITMSHFRTALDYVADSGKLLAFTPSYHPIAEVQKPKRQMRFYVNLLLPSIVSSINSDMFSSMSDSYCYEDSASVNSSLQSSHSGSLKDQPSKILHQSQEGGFKVHYANCRNTQEKESPVILRKGTYDAQKGKADGLKLPVCQSQTKMTRPPISTYNVHSNSSPVIKDVDEGLDLPVCEAKPKLRKLQNCTYDAQSDCRPLLKNIDKRLKSPCSPSKKVKPQNCTFNARTQIMNSPQLSSWLSVEDLTQNPDGPADICSFRPDGINQVHISNYREICFSNESIIDSEDVDSEAENSVLQQTCGMVLKPRNSTHEAQSNIYAQISSGTYMEESEEDYPTKSRSTPSCFLAPVGHVKVHVVAKYRSHTTVESQELKVKSTVQPLGVQLQNSTYEMANVRPRNRWLKTSTLNMSKDGNKEPRTKLCQGTKLTRPTMSLTGDGEAESPGLFHPADNQEMKLIQNASEKLWVSPTSNESLDERVSASPENVIILEEESLKTESGAHFKPEETSKSKEVTSDSSSLEQPVVSHNENEHILIRHKTSVNQTSSDENWTETKTFQDTIISNQPQDSEVREHQSLPSQEDDDDEETSLCSPLCSFIQPVLNYICSSLFNFQGF